MKISEFARMNNVTPKMLRHYDRLGLLKPSGTNEDNNYRLYDAEQSKALNWIIILKNLNFTLKEIKEVLENPVKTSYILETLKQKRTEIDFTFNDMITKKIQIDKLIRIIEKGEFDMKKEIDFMAISKEDISDILKNMPNMAVLWEKAEKFIETSPDEKYFSILHTDMVHFKQVNDVFGHEVGDKVIALTYETIKRVCSEMCEKAFTARMGGDEFVTFLICGREKCEETAKKIVEQTNALDEKTLGCNNYEGLRFGGAVCPISTDIREAISKTHETLRQASDSGGNAIVIC